MRKSLTMLPFGFVIVCPKICYGSVTSRCTATDEHISILIRCQDEATVAVDNGADLLAIPPLLDQLVLYVKL